MYSPEYSLEETGEGFEVRRYESYAVCSATMTAGKKLHDCGRQLSVVLLVLSWSGGDQAIAVKLAGLGALGCRPTGLQRSSNPETFTREFELRCLSVRWCYGNPCFWMRGCAKILRACSISTDYTTTCVVPLFNNTAADDSAQESEVLDGVTDGSGEGFNTLAGYLFGNNTQGVAMDMTTPVNIDISPTGGRWVPNNVFAATA